MDYVPRYTHYAPRYNLRQNIKMRRYRQPDAFSCLPDDLIISQIFSRLKPGTAARCSRVSRWWRCLWKQSYSCRLLFHRYFREGYKKLVWSVEEGGREFVTSVNKFLRLLKKKQTLNEFSVRFDLDKSFSKDINKWLTFTLTRGVEQLELDLSPYLFHTDKVQYVFPGIDKLPNFNASHFDGLRSICFKHVDVNGEAIEYMISKCCSLERVSVKNSNTLTYLSVCGESVARLKHLKIVGCKKAVLINISAESLVSLKYRGSRTALCLEDVPCLSELSIGGDYCQDFLRKKMSAHECISRLTKLKLEMTHEVVKKCINYPLEFENFVFLKELEVTMAICNGLFLLWPTVLIKAAPALCRFAVKLKYVGDEKLVNLQRRQYNKIPREDLDTIVVKHTPEMTREIQQKIKSASEQHQNVCLNVVEIHGFVGNKSDLKLIRHLLRMKFSSLEKLVLVTSRYAPLRDQRLWRKHQGEQQQQHSRERANLVTKWLPSSIQLVIH